MRLTAFTDYCLRTLMYLGLKPDELVTISEIAEHYDVSRNHLMKVVHELGRLGYIETVRGKHGGMRLHGNPAEIRLGDVIRGTENDLALAECMGADNNCRLAATCVLRGVLGEALEAFLEVLNRYTLEDLLAPRRELSALLAISLDNAAGEAKKRHQTDKASKALT